MVVEHDCMVYTCVILDRSLTTIQTYGSFKDAGFWMQIPPSGPCLFHLSCPPSVAGTCAMWWGIAQALGIVLGRRALRPKLPSPTLSFFLDFTAVFLTSLTTCPLGAATNTDTKQERSLSQSDFTSAVEKAMGQMITARKRAFEDFISTMGFLRSTSSFSGTWKQGGSLKRHWKIVWGTGIMRENTGQA